MADDGWSATFTVLTAEADERYPPFRWQRRLLHRFVDADLPDAVDIPTGLGKTSVMALWLIARAEGANLPRRLVYVVDRRAVVDQATRFAERLRANMKNEMSAEFAAKLGLGEREALPISTLRGGFADNRDWLDDPAKAAIVVGTVDMVGSRLLFEGYGVSRRMRPYHAGFLGVDTLVVLDEAHLCPPFEALLRQIAAQRHGTFGPASDAAGANIVPPFRLMSLSATGREMQEPSATVFRLEDEDWQDDAVVHERLMARKRLRIHEFDKANRLVSELAERACSLGVKRGPARVLVYCDTRDDAERVKRKIESRIEREKRSDCIQLLVGGRRVREREQLSEWLEDHGFLGRAGGPPEQPTFLIATSAGEVGVDLNADHMACDLVEWERMVQRLGRVNRRGKGNADIEVIPAPRTREKPAEWRMRLNRLRQPLDELRRVEVEDVDQGSQIELSFEVQDASVYADASPGAIVDLRDRAGTAPHLQDLIDAATTPTPLRPALTRPLVDAWSMTSLDKHTGRPDIQPWLRGWKKDEPQTTVLWRKHLPVRDDGSEATTTDVKAFFDAAPPHTSESLETETYRVVDWIVRRSKNLFVKDDRAVDVVTVTDDLPSDVNDDLSPLRHMDVVDVVAYVLSPARTVRSTLKGHDLRDRKDNRKKLTEAVMPGATLVVDARFGGLSEAGMLDDGIDTVPPVIDGEEEWLPPQNDKTPPVRFRVRSVAAGEVTETGEGWRERHRFVTKRTDEGEDQRWLLVEKWRHDAATEDDRSVGQLQELKEHHAWAEARARALAEAIGLEDPHASMLAIAARLHDEGKRNRLWQHAAKAPSDGRIYAKTGRMNPKLLDGYRHEFGSLPRLARDEDFASLPDDLQDLALHLVAAHHGRARPIIPRNGCDEPPSVLEERAFDVMLRFARLQKQWGPWGLAWWEALLRAADQQASRDNDSCKASRDRDAKGNV